MDGLGPEEEDAGLGLKLQRGHKDNCFPSSKFIVEFSLLVVLLVIDMCKKEYIQ